MSLHETQAVRDNAGQVVPSGSLSLWQLGASLQAISQNLRAKDMLEARDGRFATGSAQDVGKWPQVCMQLHVVQGACFFFGNKTGNLCPSLFKLLDSLL